MQAISAAQYDRHLHTTAPATPQASLAFGAAILNHDLPVLNPHFVDLAESLRHARVEHRNRDSIFDFAGSQR